MSDSAGSTTTPGPVPEPGASASASAHHFLAGRSLDALRFDLYELPSVPGRYHLKAVADERMVTVETAASGSLGELEAFLRRHLDLITAERERLAEGGGS
ncbi:MAG TPA: hypothetical protein VG276_26455 [Actinomycetes bacterium]|jgi:hypothetical protein|nr:hypothetical protein [Actinomycetes bacterium]